MQELLILYWACFEDSSCPRSLSNQGFLHSVQVKLLNEKFVAGAPEKVLEIERKKESDALAKIATIEHSLASLK